MTDTEFYVGVVNIILTGLVIALVVALGQFILNYITPGKIDANIAGNTNSAIIVSVRMVLLATIGTVAVTLGHDSNWLLSLAKAGLYAAGGLATYLTAILLISAFFIGVGSVTTQKRLAPEVWVLVAMNVSGALAAIGAMLRWYLT